MCHVSISKGNAKMGSVQSVSLPAGITCRSAIVHDAYERNYRILTEDPDTYWREVEAAVMLSRFFRFHVSGDIPDSSYLERMVEVARRNPHCEMLCFTKKYEIINEWVDNNGAFPTNLHIIMSVWRGLDCNNPYLLPEAHVRYKDGSTTASESAQECGGNCTECATADGGCWSLKYSEQVVFNEH